jgi:signal transduction histidine kinase
VTGNADEALLDLQRRLAHAQRVAALGAVVGRLAHELGTPLHSIAGHVDMLLTDPRFPDDLRGRGQVVASEIRRLSTLIRGYLRRLRAPDPEHEDTDINVLVERTMRVMEPVLSGSAVVAETDLDPAAAEPFRCDPGHVQQAVVNLVQNALDAMPDGGRLMVRTAVTEGGRAISVCDTGRGVPAEHIDRVFEPFFSTKGVHGGSGLGLAICREIAHTHGGDILLDSDPDLGTVVTLTLATPPKREVAP